MLPKHNMIQNLGLVNSILPFKHKIAGKDV